jgi:hypothetical protein
MSSQNIEVNQSVYRQQAELNEQTANAARSGFPDWSVIMCFYAALHWVNDHAFREGRIQEFSDDEDTSPHKRRRMYVKGIARKNKWPDLEDAYELLYRGSMTARYLRGLEELNCTARKYYADNNIQFYFDYLETVKKRLA